MRPVHFLIFIFFTLTCNLSAQLFELTEDRGFSNRYTKVLNVGDTLWVVAGFYQHGSVGGTGTFIKAFNQNGQELWDFDASGFQGRVIDIILNAEQELVVFGGYHIPCDIVEGHPVFITRLNLQGELISEYVHEVNLGPFEQSDLMELPSGQLVFSSDIVALGGGDVSNSLFGFSATGEQLLWESDWQQQSIDNIININESVVVFCDNLLYLVDDVGNPIDSLPYDSPPKDVSLFDENSVLLMWGDSVYTLDDSLDLVSAFSVEDEFEMANRIFVKNQFIYIWFNSTLKKYTLDFELVELMEFDILPYFNLAGLQLSDSVLCVVGSKSFDDIPVSNGGLFRSAAMAFYSTSTSSQGFNADVAIRHVALESFIGEQVYQTPPLFNFYAEVSGYLVNTGNENIHSANINFLGDLSITCGIESEHLQLTDINLLPGDSMPFSMDGLEYFSVHLSDSAGSFDFCVFASVPSGLYDRDESNDTGCATGDFGVGIQELATGISSIYPNPAQDIVTIEFSETTETGAVQVYDATGKQIEEISVNRQSQMTINVDDWNNGLYYFRIISENSASQPIKVSIVH